MLRFGSGPEQAVKFIGSGERHISTMIMITSGRAASMDPVQLQALAAALQTIPRLPAAGSGGLLNRRATRSAPSLPLEATLLGIIALGGAALMLQRHAA